MESLFITNYSEQTFLDKIKQGLRTCQSGNGHLRARRQL